MKIIISSAHGLRVAGASGLIDEVTESRRVVKRVVEFLRSASVDVIEFHEDQATNATSNINNIIAFHNAQGRDLDISVHFNSATGGTREEGIGVEVCYFAGNSETKTIAQSVAEAISGVSGLILRHNPGGPRDNGAYPRSNVAFLNRTNKPAILIEVCFVMSRTDVRLYQENFDAICLAIAERISGMEIIKTPPQPTEHWAEPSYKYLTETAGIQINERRFGDPMTRGEVFAMMERLHKSLKQ